MKKLSIPIILALVVTLVFFVSAAYSHNNSAPNMECMSCHEGEVVPGMVKIQGLPKSYTPGKTYKLTVVVTSALKSMGDVSGGFAVQAVGGKLAVTDMVNTQLSDDFITHTLEGSSLRKWNFAWKAPAGREDAALSVMAVAANGDYSSIGDNTGADSYTVKAR